MQDRKKGVHHARYIYRILCWESVLLLWKYNGLYSARSPLLNVNTPGGTVGLISNNLIVTVLHGENNKKINVRRKVPVCFYLTPIALGKRGKKEKFWRYERRLFLVKYFAWRILCLLERFYDYIIAKYRGKFSCDWERKKWKRKVL